MGPIRRPHGTGVSEYLCVSYISYLIITFSQSHNFLLSYIVSYGRGEFEGGGLPHRQIWLNSALSNNILTILTYLLTYLFTYGIHTVCSFVHTHTTLEISGDIWSYLELSGDILSYLALPEATWSRAIWSYVELSGTIWNYLERSGDI